MKILFIINDAPYGTEKAIAGTELSNMKELVQWTLDSDKTLTF